MESANRALDLVSIDDFVGTRVEGQRAELVGGIVYLMSGGTDRHNKIAVNAILALGGPSRTLGCELFMSDMALQASDDTVYYPDVMAVCDSQGDTNLTRTKPCLVIEVLSPSTKSFDEREKRIAYRQIPTMRDYLIVHPEDEMVDHHHREVSGTWSWTVRNRGDACPSTCLGPLAIEDLFVGL